MHTKEGKHLGPGMTFWTLSCLSQCFDIIPPTSLLSALSPMLPENCPNLFLLSQSTCDLSISTAGKDHTPRSSEVLSYSVACDCYHICSCAEFLQASERIREHLVPGLFHEVLSPSLVLQQEAHMNMWSMVELVLSSACVSAM